jgi:hypothetical protein
VREFTAKISTMSNTPRNDLITTMGESLRSGAGELFSDVSSARSEVDGFIELSS